MADNAPAPAPQFENFLASFGKTLSRINLYSLNHPLVQETVQQSVQDLTAFLNDVPEIILASSEGKLLLNALIITGMPSTQQMLIQFYEKNQIYSVTFRKGLTKDEMLSFYKLFTGKREDLKDAADFGKF